MIKQLYFIIRLQGFKTLFMKIMRLFYRTIFRPSFPAWPACSRDTRVNSNKIIFDLLNSDSPCFVGRMGASEGHIVLNYQTIISDKNIIRKTIDYIIRDTELPWWDEKLIFRLQNYSGFFSNNLSIKDIENFSKLYLSYIPTMDVCGRWCHYEKEMPFSKNCKMVPLESLYPFFVDNSWMIALKGKRVLVIHPFSETIKSQYEKREKLFPNEEWLPEFELKVIKAVQSIAGEKTQFNDWFEALEYMKAEIRKTDFDVAIIGCGAYGLPLAAYCKEIGKKAIHMAGGTQLLFGIKGKRWEKQYQNSCYRDLFNEHWVYPSESETPQNAKNVENGCYW